MSGGDWQADKPHGSYNHDCVLLTQHRRDGAQAGADGEVRTAQRFRAEKCTSRKRSRSGADGICNAATTGAATASATAAMAAIAVADTPKGATATAATAVADTPKGATATAATATASWDQAILTPSQLRSAVNALLLFLLEPHSWSSKHAACHVSDSARGDVEGEEAGRQGAVSRGISSSLRGAGASIALPILLLCYHEAAHFDGLI